MEYPKVKRNVLLNPGPATTTDTVKYAQIVPDICPREKEFGAIMKEMGEDLVKIVHGDLKKYTAVLFCGSGTVNIDACVNSLLPEGKKMLVVNNGAYSERAAEVCEYYHLNHINLKLSITEPADVNAVEEALKRDKDIAVVYACHHETGTGILNPIREIGAAAHKYGAIFVVDTTSTYAMMPIDMDKDNLDFVMASAQKGLMSMTGLSYVVGNTEMIEASKSYPTRSYYTNLYMQYSFIKEKGEMHFTPPVQTIYATKQAIKEYWAEGEDAKWARHQRIWEAIYKGLDRLGFETMIPKEMQSRLVVSVKYPEDPNWDFNKIHDYCFERGFTIYPGKVSNLPTFRLCCLGAIDAPDVDDFFVVLEEALLHYHIKLK
ncbi:2-aminoethylphosphonate aminotransferase [Sinanaerobacter chloroacetimidivorans]|jgi:2-aminoethylphosphonate-pyruvate transaminase|uniref:2-aminoethylphosphonate--pyruvate transaminase n=1 Tax=Sinanaerobacter chloroacetimidivorans TaxID=2818044 RepID=A0A8J8B1R9_9FIRM|nr:2-aminoethylphosphonate--pyruvate transaminase [Sinanaerobacter chloroacetimidivorans]MBR0598988.1 2-aminoethylphosphonate--pyruvate transaminase [Sinanaerobacter chloroacetimidivorans]